MNEKKRKMENRAELDFTFSHFGYHVLFYPKFNA